MFRYLILLLILFAARLCGAQSPLLSHYTVDDGLPSNTVYNICQDSKGFIWFCTDWGISRFDGRKFETFTSDDGLPDNEVFFMREDPWHRCWIISYSKSPAYIYNGKVYSAANDSLCKWIKDKGIKYSHTFTNTRKAFYLLGNGIYRVDKNRITRASFFSEFDPVHLRFDYRDKEYALGPDKMYRREDTGWKNMEVVQGRPLTGAFFIDGHLYCQEIKEGPRKPGTHSFYDVNFNSSQRHFKKVSIPHRILNFAPGRNGRVWCSTDDGVYAYDTAANEVSSKNLVTLKGTVVYNSFIDKEGNCWFATGNGVYYQPPDGAMIYSAQSGLKSDHVQSIACMPDGKLLAGYSNGYVDIVDGLHVRPFRLSAWEGWNRVIYLLPADTAHFFAGTDLGLHKINIKQQENVIINNYCQKAGTMSNSRFLYGFNGGRQGAGAILDLVTGRKQTLAFSTAINAIVAAAIDRKGTCWLGTLNGLYYFRDNKITLLNKDSILRHCRISSLAVSDADHVIVSTLTDGVFILNDTGVQHIGKTEGLISNICKQSCVDKKGRIWVITDKGMDRITLLEDHRIAIYHFSTADGMPNYMINDLAFDARKAYLATPKGIVIIDQDHGSGSVPFRTYITSVTIKDSVLQFPEEVILDHKQNNIQVSYTAISYAEGKDITYKYLLQGASTDTVKTREHILNLGALSPGHYQLMVWGAGKNNNWNQTPALLLITINPPFWKERWFLTGVASFILVVLFLLYQLRVQHVRKKEKEKAARKRRIAELEMQAIRAQVNPHFMFNALNAIQNFYSRNDELSANYYMTSFARLIRQTLSYAKEHWITISEEMSMLKAYIELEQMRFKNAFTYEIHVEPGIEQCSVPTMLLQTYTDNAINHGLRYLPGTTGKLVISCSTREDTIVCTIEDNGVGFEKAGLLDSRPGDYKSMGMKMTAGRIGIVNELYGASITVKITDRYTMDPSTQGTIIEITLRNTPVK